MNFKNILIIVMLLGTTHLYAGPALLDVNGAVVDSHQVKDIDATLEERFLALMTDKEFSEAQFFQNHPKISCKKASATSVEFWCYSFRDGLLIFE